MACAEVAARALELRTPGKVMIARPRMWNPAARTSGGMLLALAITLAACGSSGPGRSATSRVHRSSSFATTLSAFCREDTAATRAAPRTVAGQSPVQRKFIRDLETLNPPRALKPIYRRYVVLLQHNLAAFERHDVAASKRLKAEIAPVLARLRRAGATSC